MALRIAAIFLAAWTWALPGNGAVAKEGLSKLEYLKLRLQARRDGDNAREHALTKKLVQLGGPLAFIEQSRLGDQYWRGHGTARNFRKAVYWYREAAKYGSAVPAYRLAIAYYRGWGAGPDRRKTLEWLHAAAFARVPWPRAAVELSTYYRKGIGVPRDDAKADLLLGIALERILAFWSKRKWTYHPRDPVAAAYYAVSDILLCPKAAPADAQASLRFLARAYRLGDRWAWKRYGALSVAGRNRHKVCRSLK